MNSSGHKDGTRYGVNGSFLSRWTLSKLSALITSSQTSFQPHAHHGLREQCRYSVLIRKHVFILIAYFKFSLKKRNYFFSTSFVMCVLFLALHAVLHWENEGKEMIFIAIICIRARDFCEFLMMKSPIDVQIVPFS